MANDPTVVRNVHYGEQVYDDKTDSVVLVPRAAIVTGTGPDEDNGIINLFVMRPTDTAHVLGVHYSETLKANCWTWPPRS